MAKRNQPWQDQMDSLLDKFVDGQVTEDEYECRLASLVLSDEVWYYMDAAREAKADHGQLGAGS